MTNPQQPEIARSRKVPFEDQDAVESVVEIDEAKRRQTPTGRVPEENRPGHHPEHEQDKPDLEAFSSRLGLEHPDE